MTDLAATVAPKSDQLNSDDLIAGPRTITITRVTANEGGPDQPINVFFEGDGGKPWRPCKSMRRVLIAAWQADASKFGGRSLTIYRDPKVRFGGLEVGGIRISHMSHIERDLTIALTETKAQRKPFTVRRMADVPDPAAPKAPAGKPGADVGALKEKARLAAEQGTTTFLAFWNSPDTKPHWDLLRPSIEEFKALAKAADAKGAPTEGDPFSGGADDPTDADRARAAEDAEAAIRERDAAEAGE